MASNEGIPNRQIEGQDISDKGPSSLSEKTPEQREEEKLKSKYPNLKMGSGGSSLLHKRMQRGQKYFDSGDYNMAKAKIGSNKNKAQQILIDEPIGEGIPTPEDIPRKPSIVQSKLASGALS